MIKKNFKSLKVLIILSILLSTHSFSEKLGDLTRQKPIEKSIIFMGKTGENHYFKPSTLNFTTGKLYKLNILNKSDSKHYFSSNQFSKAIYTRKVQVLKNDQKISEIKGNISEIEVFPQNTVEWWFVPIKTGVFNDLMCLVKDKISNKVHADMGMIGTIIID